MQMARMSRFITGTLIECKAEVIANNVSSSVVKEFEKLCVAVRICYARAEPVRNSTAAFKETLLTCLEKGLRFQETLFPGKMASLNVNITRVMQSIRNCAYEHIPMEANYVLQAVSYMRGFMLG
ncbi:uncharacterized protein LOC135394247 [Ornithodoros turicata]|uniref:uncharacterized protein LOC135394247 n=1 Tax=Ornithodoros turicata TaxID=34597 RepID=UPI0031391F6B